MEVSIAHISYQNTWRGGEQQASYLMEELQKQGVQQVLFAPKNSPLSEKAASYGVEVIPVQSRSIWSFAKAIGHFKEDYIFHSHDSNSHTAAVIAQSFFNSSLRLIVSRRVDFPIKKSILKRWKYNHGAVKKIICVSRAIQSIMAVSISDQSKLCTVHSGVDFSRFKNSTRTNALLTLLKLPKQTTLVGNVAALAPHKDYHTWLLAAKEILRLQPDIHFVSFGDGPLKDVIHNYSRELGIEKSVTFLGFRDDIPTLLPCLDVFMFSSETEGLGTSIIDTMACRVPVAATRAGGIPELVIHEKTGLLCDPKEALSLAKNVLTILESPSLKETLIQSAFEHIKAFDKKETARHTLEIYTSI